MIVDSPGIADTDAMTQVVTEYLTEAVSFVYIINSHDAGGVSHDRVPVLYYIIFT